MRKHKVIKGDSQSQFRTPKSELLPIPNGAKKSFEVVHKVNVPLRRNENDLTRVNPYGNRAVGEYIEISGQITDSDLVPCEGLLVEIWNANHFGKYTHVDDQTDSKIDPNFLGTGRTYTDENGCYKFVTVNPGKYLADPVAQRFRPQHIHFSIIGSGKRLITQMYFPGDKYLSVDPLYQHMTCDVNEHEGELTNLAEEYVPSKCAVAKSGYRFNIVI